MSRNRALLTLIVIAILQCPGLAKNRAHHGAGKPPVANKSTNSKSATAASTAIGQNGPEANTATTTIVRTESRLMPHDMDNISAPDGALYTTSDDCG